MSEESIKSIQYYESGLIKTSSLSMVKSQKTLDVGTYKIIPTDQGPHVKNMSLRPPQNMHSFPRKDEIDQIMKAFFKKGVKKKINALDLNHKLGIILYGKEGTGKTTILQNYCVSLMKEQKAIVFYIPTNIGGSGLFQCWQFIQDIRDIQDNPIVVVFEECEGNIRSCESTYKVILDGEDSIDNCIVFATTNYITAVPDALKNRPSRFKYALDIPGIHDIKIILPILERGIGDMFDKKELIAHAESLKGQTVDMIKQFCLDKIMGLTIPDITATVIEEVEDAEEVEDVDYFDQAEPFPGLARMVKSAQAAKYRKTKP